MIFRVDLKIFIFLVILYFTRQIEIYSILMIMVMLHELCHLIAGIIVGFKVNKIEISPIGLAIGFKINTNDYNKKIHKSNLLEVKKIIVALAGPLFNFVTTLIIGICHTDNRTMLTIAYSNLIILIFNLIPIYPLDGGRILKSILNIRFGKIKANTYIYLISNICISVITVIFSILVYYYKNIGVIIILLYLWYIVLKENQILKTKSKIYNTIQQIR